MSDPSPKDAGPFPAKATGTEPTSDPSRDGNTLAGPRSGGQSLTGGPVAEGPTSETLDCLTQEHLRVRDSGLLDALESPPIPALTILFHPRAGRIGDRVLLSSLKEGEAVELSRRDPVFSTPGTGRQAPLGDRRLSRQPLRLVPTRDGGIALDPAGSPIRVTLQGEPLTGPVTWPAEEIERGVVLMLSRRIVLLLHHHRAVLEPTRERFGLVGESSAIARLRFEIAQVADLSVPVLLRGATGTGKELVAQALHRHSRRQGELVALNLGAIPGSLAASELFGATKGSFTGATHSQPGYFQRADRGTLFLDEIGEAPVDVQVQLLRVLETGELQTVGRQKPQKVDVRLVAATDADLEALAERGDFRAPLLHRLAGFEIHLPLLDRRRDDLGRLLIHFLRGELETVGESARLRSDDVSQWLRPTLVAHLAETEWPGNVRQLRNIARQLVIAGRGLHKLSLSPRIERLLSSSPSRGDSTDIDLDDSRDLDSREQDSRDLDSRDFDSRDFDSRDLDSRDLPFDAAKTAVASPRRRRPASVGEDELRDTLQVCRWDLKATAEMLRISRTSLYALIEKFPSLRAPGDIPNDEIRSAFENHQGDLEAMVETLEISRHALQRRLRELGLGPNSRQ